MGDETKKIFHYVDPGKDAMTAESLYLIVVGVLGVMNGILENNLMAAIIIGIVIFMAGMISLIVRTIIPVHTVKKRLKELEAGPFGQMMIDDFNHGDDIISDRARVGQVFFFGKHTGAVCLIDEIERVYVYEKISRGFRMAGWIGARIVQDDITLCKLKGRDVIYMTLPARDPDVKDLYRRLSRRNKKIIYERRIRK